MILPGVGSIYSGFEAHAYNAGPRTLVPAESGKRPVILLTYRNGFSGGTPENTGIQTSTGNRFLSRLTLASANGEPHTILLVGDVGEGIKSQIGGGPTSGAAYYVFTYGYLPS